MEPIAEGTLGSLLSTLVERRGDGEALTYPAFVHGDSPLRMSFRQLDERVDLIARGLMYLGIERGEHVAVWAQNVPDWVPLQFALARIGAVLVTVNTALKADELAYVLDQCQAVAILHGARHGNLEPTAVLDSLFERRDAALSRLRYRVWLPSGPGELAPRGIHPMSGDQDVVRGPLFSLAEVMDGSRHVTAEALAERQAACRPEDVVNIQYTSGTTGFPKGVMLSHANLIANAHAIGALMHTTPDDRVALMVPLFHCFGCVVCVLGAYTHGATLCCIPAFEPGAALRLIAEEKITILHGVPTMFSALINHPDRENFASASLRTGFVAGAPVPAALMELIRDRLDCPGIGIAYGLTETSPGVTGVRPEEPFERRAHAVGRPLPNVQVRIADPATGDPRPIGDEGEVWVSGPNVMVGYHNDESATAAAITDDGWFRTGDLGSVDAEGYLHISGRLKDLIIRGGENVAPAEIEAVLRTHPSVADASVVGVPHERLGEEVAAAIIPTAGSALDTEALAAYVGERLAAFKVPRVWKTFDTFPLTGSGKVKKFALRALFDMPD